MCKSRIHRTRLYIVKQTQKQTWESSGASNTARPNPWAYGYHVGNAVSTSKEWDLQRDVSLASKKPQQERSPIPTTLDRQYPQHPNPHLDCISWESALCTNPCHSSDIKFQHWEMSGKGICMIDFAMVFMWLHFFLPMVCCSVTLFHSEMTGESFSWSFAIRIITVFAARPIPR